MALNIRVNCLVPGGVHFNQTKQFIKNYSKLTPMKRMMKSGELNLIVDYLSLMLVKSPATYFFLLINYDIFLLLLHYLIFHFLLKKKIRLKQLIAKIKNLGDAFSYTNLNQNVL